MEQKDLQKLYELVIGINRIYFEMIENYRAFYSLNWNSNIDTSKPLPIALFMLMKNHYQIYVIEASKILHSGDHHFQLNKALNIISKRQSCIRIARELKKKLKEHNVTIEQIRQTRNQIFAHLDQDWHHFKNPLDNISSDKLHETVKEIVDFLNDSIPMPSPLDYREWQDTSIGTFYDLVYTRIVNHECSEELSSQGWI